MKFRSNQTSATHTVVAVVGAPQVLWDLFILGAIALCIIVYFYQNPLLPIFRDVCLANETDKIACRFSLENGCECVLNLNP